MTNVRYLKVEKSEGRRFAISDIHGCHRSFKLLLKQIRLQKKDQLFILGDMINRGKNSAKVLDKIMALIAEGHEIYLLKGNHEQRIINAAHKTEEQLLKTLKKNNSSDLKKAGEEKWRSYLKLMDSAYHYFELEDYLLVHAGFDFTLDFPFKAIHPMLYKRNFKIDKSKIDNKRVIHGHTPQNISNIIKRLKAGKRKVCIDNGCVNSKTAEQGNLVCLNLDTNALIIQPNAEK